MNPPTTAQDRRFRERLARRAIETRADLLAVPLHAYARAEGMDWRGLADHLGCSEDALNRIALCRPPRPEHFVGDVEAIAENLVDFDRLLNLLRRFQVLNAFAAHAAETNAGDNAPASGMLLAARDREEEEETRRQGEEEKQSTIHNPQSTMDSSFILHPPSLPNEENS